MTGSGAGPENTFHAQVIAALREVGDTAILPRFNKLAKGDIRTKTHAGDLVTIADEEAETLLTGRFLKLVPGSVVVGEEGAARDSQVLYRLQEDAPTWIIDPVDGTKNFVEGVGRFAMIVALVRGGETLMGWIHDPLAGVTLAAEKGAGAWQVKPDGTTAPVRIPPIAPDISEMISAHHHRAFGPKLGAFARNVHLGSAAHDYWSAADGRVQIVSYRKLRPWDHAAGVLIHAEAGGYNRLLSGEPYRPIAGQEGLLCAPNADIWARVAALAER